MLKALDLAKDLEAGQLTPRALVDRLAEVIAKRDGEIRAFAHLDLKALCRAADEYSGRGALHGLPVAFKDIIDTADLPTECGSPIYKGWQPRADAPIVQMTREAGGLLLGKSVTTEFAFLNPSETVNPHSPYHTPGGSSSGSAAGVAAGMMPLAFGTQTGGSVIRPASYCGVAAIKTSFRLLPAVGVKVGAWTLDTLGLFGARVRDIAFGLEAITGRDLRVDGREVGTPRFGVCRMEFAGAAQPEAEEALSRAIRAVEARGARVVDIAFPQELVAGHEVHATIYNYEARVALAWEIANHRDLLSPILLEHYMPSQPIGVEEYDRARGIARQARRAAKSVFSEIDALITYSAPGQAPDRSTTGASTYNRLFTLLGLPAVNVPGLVSAQGLPLGIQVVSAFGKDLKALQAAQYVESAISSDL